ncbi:MAG: hypothetical protein ACREOU_03325 [Candidatus Eiseniibacteriota bacterium]
MAVEIEKEPNRTRRQTMAEQGGSGNSVKMVAIVAILVLVALAAWFFMGQRFRQAATSPPAAKAPASEEKADIKVEVDLPDSVTIKP